MPWHPSKLNAFSVVSGLLEHPTPGELLPTEHDDRQAAAAALRRVLGEPSDKTLLLLSPDEADVVRELLADHAGILRRGLRHLGDAPDAVAAEARARACEAILERARAPTRSQAPAPAAFPCANCGHTLTFKPEAGAWIHLSHEIPRLARPNYKCHCGCTRPVRRPSTARTSPVEA